MQETNTYDDVLRSAYNTYRRNAYDMDEASGLVSTDRERIENWHKCIGWAIDELDLSSIDKLFIFSQCVIDIESTLARMRCVMEQE